MPHSSRFTWAPLVALLAICTCLFLCGCGESLSGTYSADGPGGAVFTIQFTSGGKATVSVMGQSKEGTYKVKGDKVTVTIDNSPAVFIKHKDGSLTGEGEMAVTLKKTK